MTIGTRNRQLNYQGNFVNNTRRHQLANRLDKGGLVYEADTISAVASTDSIDDSGSSLPVFPTGLPIDVRGLENNSRIWQATGTPDASSAPVLPAVVVDEAEGAKVIVRSA